MTRIILTHVGTSLLTNPQPGSGEPDRDRLHQDLRQRVAAARLHRPAGPVVPPPNGFQDFTDPLERSVAAQVVAEGQKTWDPAKPYTRDQRHGRASAEISSLVALPLEAGDRIVLVASDTDLGWYCARVVYHLLCTVPNLAGVSIGPADGEAGIHVAPIYQIPGLDVESEEAGAEFPQAGLRAYFQLVWSLWQQAQDDAAELIFNVTPGYKGLIPYAALLTTLLAGAFPGGPAHARLYYLYERSVAPIWMPVLPLRLAAEALEPTWAVLVRIRSAGRLSYDDPLVAALPAETRTRYLVEETLPAEPGRWWGLTPVADLLLDLRTRLPGAAG